MGGTENVDDFGSDEVIILAGDDGESFSKQSLSGSPEALIPEVLFFGDVRRKARRTKEEIEYEKMVKEINCIRRKMNAAKNSRCEQYLFCHVNSNILFMDKQIKPELVLRFNERSIADQLHFSDNAVEPTVVWKRKRIDAYIEDRKLHTATSFNIENNFVAVLNGESLTAMLKEKSALLFLRRQLDSHQSVTPQLSVLVIGRCGVRNSTLNDFLFDAYERLRVQFCFLKSATDLSYFIAQMHRAIAKSEKKAERKCKELPVFAMQKGVREGDYLVRDWWSRMLDHVHRMTEDQKRKLIDRYPSPMDLMDVILATEGAGEAMFQLANIKVSRNKCLGPTLAQKLYAILTSWYGSEIIHLT